MMMMMKGNTNKKERKIKGEVEHNCAKNNMYFVIL